MNTVTNGRLVGGIALECPLIMGLEEVAVYTLVREEREEGSRG